MRIASITLKNWMCYRGVVELELDAKAYAVLAQYERNPERSNWAGKSALLEAIDFAINGRLNPKRGMGADGWISDGAGEGMVQVSFVGDRATTIRRERKRGKSTKVTYDGAAKDDAEAALRRDVGLSEVDFLATCFVQQRQMARLVLAKPEERMDVIRAWFQLAPVESAEGIAAGEAGARMARYNELHTRSQTLAELYKKMCPEGSLTALDKVRQDAVQAHLAAVMVRKEAEKQLHAAEQSQKIGALEAQYDVVVQEGTELRAKVDAANEKELLQHRDYTGKQMQIVAENLGMTKRAYYDLEKVAAGQFDGKCPLSQIECPARQQINAGREQHRARAQKARGEANQLVKLNAEWTEKYQHAEAALQEHTRQVARLETLRSQVSRLKEELERAGDVAPVDPVPYREVVKRAMDEEATAKSAVDNATFVYSKAHEAHDQWCAVEHEKELVQKDARPHLEAAKVLRAAQRRIAETALSEIAEGANAMLAESGIDLEIDVTWTREGKGLASTCDTCGAAFSTSARVKACVCGAARGHNLVNKLEVALSDQSGAAEDLAGAALQFAGASWLRADRGSAWGVALIDEPFGQLDGSNRKALAMHFAALLKSRYGFEQAFIIAHHSAALDALPGRILVTAGPNGSTARVVA